ncbi:hypothetical protein C8R44DRAFT_742348 [Mycena epipterygia]|nr:hypothetical protein C8R44DRAFT_742348 [Mycena epipterygia]
MYPILTFVLVAVRKVFKSRRTVLCLYRREWKEATTTSSTLPWSLRWSDRNTPMEYLKSLPWSASSTPGEVRNVRKNLHRSDQRHSKRVYTLVEIVIWHNGHPTLAQVPVLPATAINAIVGARLLLNIKNLASATNDETVPTVEMSNISHPRRRKVHLPWYLQTGEEPSSKDGNRGIVDEHWR